MTWFELTYPEAEAWLKKGAVAFLPCGAIEAHGPHLPLGTDVIIAREAAERAVRVLLRAGTPAVMLPAINYTVTDYASEFSGTLSIAKETASLVVRDVLLAATRAGVRGIVVVNAHLEPAHIAAITEGVEAAIAAGARVAFPDITRKPHALKLGDEFRSGACHAGSYETSLMLAARPDLVQEQLAATLEPNPTSLSIAIREGKRTFREAGGPHAYFGDPAAGTEREGEMLYGILADIFASEARLLLAS